MLNLGVLDTAIAVVIVLLLLSLIVQSIQTFLKKITRFKSRQIAASLEKLFTQVPQTAATGTPKEMKDSVLKYFADLGRASWFGNHALESLSKSDLSKIVASVQASHLLPERAMQAIDDFYAQYSEIPAAVKELTKVSFSAETQAKLTQFVAQIAPIDAQVTNLFKAGQIDSKVLAGDILGLRNLDLTAVVTAATELQKSIESDAAAQPNNDLLKKAAADASTLAQVIGNVNTHIAIAKAQLNARLTTLESWFDTVMQGFEERYARNMRTWSFVIGLGVAIAMNANIVQVYQRFSGDEIERQRVIAKGAAIQEQYTKQITGTTTDTKIIQDLKNELATNAKTYNALGFTPMTWETWESIWEKPLTIDPWETLLGWIIMAFLLSLGAPFWHDALGSLFGVKNLLQQKTDQKNVEQGSGQGQTQST
ncbi:MAG TPA: hypothetical protein VGJ82_17705 [Thermoanaerobaculia bacterium]|jgi:hypothetical protein